MMNVKTIKRRRTIALKPLPYAFGALAPHISEKSLRMHFEVINQCYLDRLNWLKDGTEFADLTTEEIIIRAAGKDYRMEMFTNATQAWCHAFYWRCLRPSGGEGPSVALRGVIDDSFGSLDACKKKLTLAAAAQAGNGWVWLVQEGTKMKVLATGDAETPMTDGLKPLLGIDIWEHAYFLDYGNRRNDYVRALLEKLVNWEFVESNLLK